MLPTAVVEPLLEAIRNRAAATGVYFYRFNLETRTARLEGLAGPQSEVDSEDLDGPLINDHLRLTAPVVLHSASWRDPRFAIFPEIHRRRLEGLVSVPLLHDGVTVGLLIVARAEPASLPPGILASLLGLALPMGALVAAGNEYARLSEQLADRKILDRAKGILQDRLAWTEEEAYLQLRRTSRQRRTKIRDIAREIVDTGVPRNWEARRAS